jgi:hypothetical protein
MYIGSLFGGKSFKHGAGAGVGKYPFMLHFFNAQFRKTNGRGGTPFPLFTCMIVPPVPLPLAYRLWAIKTEKIISKNDYF